MAKHIWDQVVDSITSWVESEADWHAQALMGGGHAPFAQQVSEKEKRDYYQSQMYNEDGSPNETGRQQVLQRIGIQNYVPLLQELEKSRRNHLPSEPPIPAQETSPLPTPTPPPSSANPPEKPAPQVSTPTPQQGPY